MSGFMSIVAGPVRLRRGALALPVLLAACSSTGYLENDNKPALNPDAGTPVDPPDAAVRAGSGGTAGTWVAGVSGSGGGSWATGGATTPTGGTWATGGGAPVGTPGSTTTGGAAATGGSGAPGGSAATGGAAVAIQNDGSIPSEIATILSSRCSGCHTYGQGDVGFWGSVMDLSRMIDAEIVVPGNPNASRMMDRIVVRGDMPPRGDPLPTADVEKLRNWIANLKRPAVTPRTDADILDAIATDVNSLRSFSSDFRYFSLAHFADLGRPTGEVTKAKNTLAFAVNSLSRRGTIVPMVAVDSKNSIYRVRLSDLGWSNAIWDQLTSFYPYCLASDIAGHRALYTQLGTEAPFVRGDWLLDTATRPPLYDLLVDLPATVDALAARLGVNIADDINHLNSVEPENLVRFAVRRSGVSLHNRMAERHLGAAGQYLWISYDFKTDIGRQDVFANPLGPAALDRRNFVHTFQHDAGEVIFSLPNGMQGYMLTDAVGRKVAVADTAVVRDIRRPNGVVENGISCFGCHGNNGMVRPRQTNEVSTYINGHVGDFLNREFNEISVLYPSVLMPDYFSTDSARYRGAVDSLDGGGPPRGAIEYTEFVGLVGQYESNLGFRGAAAEFNEDLTSFKNRVLTNDFDNRTLPRTPEDPLISRVDFVCAWRDLATQIRPQRFCNKTFNAAAVAGLCP